MARPVERRSLHVLLPFLAPDRRPELHVGLRRYPLQRHTPQTLAAARETNRALRRLPDEQVTHFIDDVELPSDQAQLLLVSEPARDEGAKLPTLLLTKIHVPRAARIADTQRRLAEGSHGPDAALLLAGADDDGSDPELPPDVDDTVSAMDAAVQSIFQHVELFNIGATTAATVTGIIKNANGTSDLANEILQQADAYANSKHPKLLVNWVYETPYSNPDGSAPPSNPSRWVWSDTTLQWMTAPMQHALTTAKNTPGLQSSATVAGSYTVQDGVTLVGSSQGGEPAALAGPHVVEAVVAQDDTGGLSWTVNDLTPQNGFTYNNDIAVVDGQFTASFTNSWLRWLSGYVEFLGPDGEVVAPESWASQVPQDTDDPGANDIYDTDTQKYVGMFSAVDTILAIPVAAEPTTISFAWPSNASGVRISAGGIGRTGGIEGQGGAYYGGWDTQICTAGAMMTGLFNFGIPTVMLAMGAAVPQTELSDCAKACLPIALDIGTALLDGPLASQIAGGSTDTILTAFADAIPHLLLDSPDLVAQLVTIGIGEEAVEEATPIFGWIALGLSVVTTVADLSETTAEVASSPATFEVVATAAIDAQWTLLPDPDHQEWPEEAVQYTVTATFTDGTTRATTGTLPPPPTANPITVSFDATNANQLPAGGTVQFAASFTTSTGWCIGSAASAPLSAAVSSTIEVPTQAITEIPMPLDASTIYEWQTTLAYDAGTGTRIWGTERSTATLTSLQQTNTEPAIGALGQITFNQPALLLGYDWQASFQNLPLEGSTTPTNAQGFVFQTISQLNPQDGVSTVPASFESAAPIGFGLQEPATGDNFYIDPGGDEYQLRQLVLGEPGAPIVFPVNESFGRFNEPIDDFVVHPAGYAIGVNTANSKLEVLALPAAATTDADAPLAEMYAGYGSRPGLLHEPVGVAAAPGSAVVVLENADATLPAPAQLQAFDMCGNPATIFAGGTSSTAALQEESGGFTALGIAIEPAGYIYVLKYVGDGSADQDYWLDLYSPDGSFLCQTNGLPAGAITVDPWRTLYTLDFQMMSKPAGLAPEPTVTQWLPFTPS
jgi:hypothetical protein